MTNGPKLAVDTRGIERPLDAANSEVLPPLPEQTLEIIAGKPLEQKIEENVEAKERGEIIDLPRKHEREAASSPEDLANLSLQRTLSAIPEVQRPVAAPERRERRLVISPPPDTESRRTRTVRTPRGIRRLFRGNMTILDRLAQFLVDKIKSFIERMLSAMQKVPFIPPLHPNARTRRKGPHGEPLQDPVVQVSQESSPLTAPKSEESPVPE